MTDAAVTLIDLSTFRRENLDAIIFSGRFTGYPFECPKSYVLRSRFGHFVGGLPLWGIKNRMNFSAQSNLSRILKFAQCLLPDEYRLKYGGHINLLYASEVQAACYPADLSLKMAIVDRQFEIMETLVLHSYWRERNEIDDLAVWIALYFNPMRNEAESPIL